VFNVEALTSDTIIQLTDKDLKFQNISKNENVCYKYNIPAKDAKEDVIIDVKPISGELQLFLSPVKLPTAQNYTLEFNVKKETKFNLSNILRKQQESGDWFLCVTTSDKFSFFAIQVFLATNTLYVEEYKKLLLSKHIINNSKILLKVQDCMMLIT